MKAALIALLLAGTPAAAQVARPAPRADGLDGGSALRPLRTGTDPLVTRGEPVVRFTIARPMPAPAWALAQRHLLAMNAEGARAFAARFVDERGWLKGAAHWGIADGPDDAVEPIRNWPLAHMLGGPEYLVEQWSRIWEGHLDQFSRAAIPTVAMAKDGIYRREFSPSFDWEHIGEGISGYLFYGLSRPDDPLYRVRMERFAGFYDGSDPAAPNYDPEHRIIRSLWNGSQGPTMRLPTVDEWDGPGVTGQNSLRRTRFAGVTSIVGDHPLNLGATNLAMTAYLLTGKSQYRDWLLGYVDAWAARIVSNGGNIPSNIGLDGSIGGAADGKWYGGVFGWNSPDTGRRNYVLRGPPEGFGNALMLTGDQRYAAVLRRQLDNLYAQKRVERGVTKLPVYYGDAGWHGWFDAAGSTPGLSNRRQVEVDVALWSGRKDDRLRAAADPWIAYLDGRNPKYPEEALAKELDEVRAGVARIRDDDSTIGFPADSTRWEEANAVATTALINLTMGANDPGGSGHGPMLLHAALRYFDPAARRAGLPPDVAALVSHLDTASVTVTLVNTHASASRTVVVQTGAYAEHKVRSVTVSGRSLPIDASTFEVTLQPGAGDTFTLALNRYSRQPTLLFPWQR